MKRIEPGKKEPQRVRGLLKIDIVHGIANEKRRVVDHEEVLRRRWTLRHAHQLDRHATAVADRVPLRGARAVGEPDPGGKGAGLREDADTQGCRKIVEHPEFGAHAAMGLGMRVSVCGAAFRGRAHLVLDPAHDRRDRVGFSRRYAFADGCTGRVSGACSAVLAWGCHDTSSNLRGRPMRDVCRGQQVVQDSKLFGSAEGLQCEVDRSEIIWFSKREQLERSASWSQFLYKPIVAYR